MNDMTRGALVPAANFVPLADLQLMAGAIAESGLFGMKTKNQALALMLIAQAEGQHPATITQDYDIIQGRAARKTNSVLARFQAAGGSIEWHALTDKIADATFTPPKGSGKPLRLDWTIEMAKTAKLAGKDNWTGYARAMLRARLIAEGVRATYPAALGGMLVAEEAQDLGPVPEKDVTSHGSHTTEPAKAESEVKMYDVAAFDRNLPKWRTAIEAKKKTADDIIAMAETKGLLTDAQKRQVRGESETKEAIEVDDSEGASDDELAAMFKKAEDSSISHGDLDKHWQARFGLDLSQPMTITKKMVESALAFIADPVGGGK